MGDQGDNMDVEESGHKVVDAPVPSLAEEVCSMVQKENCICPF